MSKIIRLSAGSDNCYALCGDDNQTILVDTCRKKDRKKLLEKIKEFDIKLIILTHGHIDHIENVSFFAKHFNAKIAMHKNDYILLQNNLVRKIYAKSFFGKVIKFISAITAKNIKLEPFEPDIYLQDGQSLLEYGIDATVIILPGHTAGSIGIKSAGKSFIVGDALMNMLFPTGALIAEDFGVLENTLNFLRECDSEIFYVGHGKPIRTKRF